MEGSNFGENVRPVLARKKDVKGVEEEEEEEEGESKFYLFSPKFMFRGRHHDFFD